jgi:hypothetical protein
MDRHQLGAGRLQLVDIATAGKEIKCQLRSQIGDPRGDATRTDPQCVSELPLVSLTHRQTGHRVGQQLQITRRILDTGNDPGQRIHGRASQHQWRVLKTSAEGFLRYFTKTLHL